MVRQLSLSPGFLFCDNYWAGQSSYRRQNLLQFKPMNTLNIIKITLKLWHQLLHVSGITGPIIRAHTIVQNSFFTISGGRAAKLPFSSHNSVYYIHITHSEVISKQKMLKKQVCIIVCSLMGGQRDLTHVAAGELRHSCDFNTAEWIHWLKM